jgi:hypothetical protein
MTIEQQKLALQVVSQLTRAKENAQRQLGNMLKNGVSEIIKNGVIRGGVNVSVDELKEVAGNELWAQIEAEAAAMEAFINS